MLGFLYFYPGFFMHMLFMLPFLVLSMWAASRVKGTFAKYSQGRLRSGITGAQVADMILRSAGIDDVTIKPSRGLLSDHYNPLNKTVNLSPEVLNGASPAAVGVAAHEVGHAIQHARAYGPLMARHYIAPVAGIASNLAIPLIFIGLIFSAFGKVFVLAAIACFAFAVLFHLVTLPVEFDASRRAVAILGSSGVVTDEEMVGVRKTLSAAGFTYLAAALAAVGELVFWLLQAGLLGGDE